MSLTVAHNYYEILGVSPDASEEEIKHAYARRRRALQQEGKTEELTILLQAKSVLTDPQARRHYDARLQYGPSAQALYEKAMQSIAEDEWEAAVKSLKQVIALVPTACEVWNDLGFALFKTGDIAESISVYDKLTTMAPEVAAYLVAAARVLLEASRMCGVIQGTEVIARCPTCSTEVSIPVKSLKRQKVVQCSQCEDTFTVIKYEKSQLLQKARNLLAKAIKIDPKASAPYIYMAFTYVAEQQLETAIEWTHKGIIADEKIDIQDTDDLFLLCDLYVATNKPAMLLETVERMKKITEDVEFAKFMKARFYHQAGDAIRSGRFTVAHLYVEAAAHAHPDQEDHALLAHLKLLAQCEAEWADARNDQNMPDFLKMRFITVMLESTVIDNEPTEAQKRAIQHLKLQSGIVLKQTPPEELSKGIKYLRGRYPAFYNLDKEFIDHLNSALRQSGFGSGCATLAALFVIVLCLSLFLL